MGWPGVVLSWGWRYRNSSTDSWWSPGIVIVAENTSSEAFVSYLECPFWPFPRQLHDYDMIVTAREFAQVVAHVQDEG